MTQQIWSDIDQFFGNRFRKRDPVLEDVMQANRLAELPAIDVSPALGQFLNMMVRITRAARVLEIGTLGGYSSIWMARAIPPDGHLVTLELEPKHAQVAISNFRRAGLDNRIDLRQGDALESLASLQKEQAAPFDMIFIDADKPRSAEYFSWAIRLAHPGSLIIVDNVVRNGDILNPDSDDANVQGIQRLADYLVTETRVSVTEVQTVGTKGYDGFLMAIVNSLQEPDSHRD